MHPMMMGGMKNDDQSRYHPRLALAQEMIELFNIRMMKDEENYEEQDALSLKERETYYGCLDTIRNFVLGEIDFEDQKPSIIHVQVPREEMMELLNLPEPPEDDNTPPVQPRG